MALDFSRRSTQAEIMDDMTLGGEAMAEILGELDLINRLLGGHATTLDALDRLLPPGGGPLRLLDVGAGGGDMARVLVEWGRRTGRRVEVVSVDLNFAAVEFARERLALWPEAAVLQADVLALPFPPEAFDAALCSLFLHHFRQEEAARLLSAVYAVSRHGVVVNDLHRHPLAYAGFWLFSRLVGACKIVRHDGLLSVLRAFRREDFEALSRMTGLELEVRWRWAFRYQVLIRKAAGPERAT